MTLRLFVMRHGETQWSLSGQHTGRVDIPLTARGQEEARGIGERIRGIEFSSVFVSPLERARHTCELAGCGEQAQVEADLIEWANGDYEGRTRAEVCAQRPGWNLFRDGCPNGEMPEQISARADRLINRLKSVDGNVGLFTHSHFARVFAARWIGLPVEEAQHFLLNTGSLSVLCYESEHTDLPVIALWNSITTEPFR